MIFAAMLVCPKVFWPKISQFLHRLRLLQRQQRHHRKNVATVDSCTAASRRSGSSAAEGSDVGFEWVISWWKMLFSPWKLWVFSRKNDEIGISPLCANKIPIKQSTNMRNGKHNMIWLGTIRALICKNWWFKDDQAWLKLLSTSPQLTWTWVVGIPPSKWQAWHFMTRSNTSGFSIATLDYPLGHAWPNRNSIIHVAAPAAPPLSFAGNAASKGMVTIKMACRVPHGNSVRFDMLWNWKPM